MSKTQIVEGDKPPISLPGRKLSPPQDLPTEAEMGTEVPRVPAGTRFSNYNVPCRTARMERFLKRVGVTGKQYSAWTGGQPLNAFAKENPGWCQRAWEVL